jgi:hypothetical protein
MYKRPGIFFFCLCCLSCLTMGALAQDSSREAGRADSAVKAVVDSVAGTDTANRTAADTAAGTSAEVWYTPRKNDPGGEPFRIPVFRKLSDSTMRDLLRDDDFWYVPVGPDKKKPAAGKPHPFEMKKWVPFLIYSLIAGLLVAAIVYLLQSGSGENWFRSSRRKTAAPEKTVESIVPADPQEMLRAAVDRGDYTTAVRYLFLITLGRLGDRNLILPGRDKTNREYGRELRENPLYADFSRLAGHYEYTFYGGFTLDEVSFREIRKQYEQFQNRLDAL